MLTSIRYFFITILLSTALFAQNSSIDDALKGLAPEIGSAYVSPIISAFGANLNSGWVHRAPRSVVWGIDLEVGVVAMGTMFKDENKSFSLQAPFTMDRAEANQLITQNGFSGAQRDSLVSALIKKTFTITVAGPTVVGSKDKYVTAVMSGQSVTYTQPNGTVTTYNFTNNGKDTVHTPANGVLGELALLPLAAPQISIGTLYGTTVSVRYLPNIKLKDELGEIKYSGFGIQHNPSMWIPFPMPLEISVAYFTQKMDVGSVFSSKASMFGLFASKKFGFGALNITPYGGIAFESSKVTVNYSYILKDVPTVGATKTIPVNFELEGENSSRITLGFSLKLGIFNINADYNIAKYSAFSGGFSFLF